MTTELAIRSDLERRTELRAEFHRLMLLLKGKRVFPAATTHWNQDGVEARRKVIVSFLDAPCESMNGLSVEQWLSVNESIKEHFGLEDK